MLRVLTLATLFPDASRPTFGGFVERQTLGLAARDDVELEVVAPIGIPPWPFRRHTRHAALADVPEQEVWKDVIVHRPRFRTIPKIGGPLAPAAMARALGPLLRTIRERFPFDIIDAEFFYPDGPAAMRLAREFDLPFSVKARGADIHYWGRRTGSAAQVLAAADAADGLLAVSEALRTDMVALGMTADKIAVHYTGIDKSRFRPVDRSAAKEALGVEGPLIVTVGALIPRKGQRLVVEALADIPDARLWCVGEGEDRPMLEKRARDLGLADRVHLPGNLPHDDVANLLAAADVMVLPSASEGLANAWVEALASGTPIVISAVGGAAELVDRPEAGAIVDRSPRAIADAVRALLADPPDPYKVRAAVDRFSWERNSETLFAHLSALVERQ
ncbi:glycosyltransferase family 4 protein [Parasphingopyxis algicola]|uniref:glycosyltransferase n=1 Tax=Parasphingopyxis algicola TaxID=2026624 RepID=UPI0015A2B30A|nr:glycosyltransferase [Parasphingopyxis algicola]QLC26890.1 glycosyltransferase family 4 protein [Parasphingopyxis algicola]